MKVLHTENDYRIVEIQDEIYNIDDLKGDCFNVELNESETLSAETIKAQEKQFEYDVKTKGVYGYQLEKWNSEIDQGWCHIDSCFGFIGEYDEIENKHYIVDEMKNTIKDENKTDQNFKYKKEYLNEATCCPCCGVDAAIMEQTDATGAFLGTTVELKIACLECNNDFVEVYKLVDVKEAV